MTWKSWLSTSSCLVCSISLAVAAGCGSSSPAGGNGGGAGSSSAGAAGDTGAAGNTGAAGDTGAAGNTGAAGDTGAAGTGTTDGGTAGTGATGAMPDGGAAGSDACAYALTGAVSRTNSPCVASVVYLNGNPQLRISDNPPMSGGGFGVQVQVGNPPTVGTTYTPMNTSFSYIHWGFGTAGSWQEQRIIAQPAMGTFSLTFTTATPETVDGGTRYAVHGTLTATMPADMLNSNATGTIEATVTF